MSDKFHASILLHALGDALGFKNGDWEFNYQQEDIVPSFTFELVSDFISLGGITSINLKDWNVSDDTILHLDTANALVKSSSSLDIYIMELIKNFKNSLDSIKKRYGGIATMNAIEKLKKDINYKKFTFNKKGGGSGGSMRTSCIGLFFNKEEQLDKLIQFSIENCYITHNHPTGYLGGVVAALFTSYAYNQIPIIDWPFKMIELITSQRFDDLMKQYVDYKVFTNYKHSFIGLWKSYIEDKFTDEKEIKMSIKNLAQRCKYYLDNISYKTNFIGTSGDDSVIVAYDCFIDSNGCFEKLIYYSMLHIGDTDTTGCISGSFYGAMYGLKNIPKNLYENLEFKSEIDDISKKLYDISNKI